VAWVRRRRRNRRQWSPLDLDSAVGLVEQVLHVGTTAGMHRDALAAGDIADDLFAADGVATARAVDQEIVLAFHLERLRALPKKTRLTASDIWPSVLLTTPSGAAGSIAMVEPGSSLLSTGALSTCRSRRRPAARRACQAILRGNLVVVGLVILGERDLVLARLALQQLATHFDGALALVLVEPVLDLVAARELLAKLSQSRLGEWPAWVVISTMSPLRSLERSGTMRPLTLAPVVVLPPGCGWRRRSRWGWRPWAGPRPCPWSEDVDLLW